MLTLSQLIAFAKQINYDDQCIEETHNITYGIPHHTIHECILDLFSIDPIVLPSIKVLFPSIRQLANELCINLFLSDENRLEISNQYNRFRRSILITKEGDSFHSAKYNNEIYLPTEIVEQFVEQLHLSSVNDLNQYIPQQPTKKLTMANTLPQITQLAEQLGISVVNESGKKKKKADLLAEIYND